MNPTVYRYNDKGVDLDRIRIDDNINKTSSETSL